MGKIFLFAIIGLSCLGLLNSCAILTKSIKRSKNIAYTDLKVPNVDSMYHQLDVYAPASKKKARAVLVFIHGGNWDYGDKAQYKFLGARLARKGIVAVVINYRLGAAVRYWEMAEDAASAVKWVKENISEYRGDPRNIYVAGHSAGGHLAALIATDPTYFDSLQIANPIQGVVLIDAAGLDMYSYLMEHQQGEGKRYLSTFTTQPQVWKKASPRYHLNANSPPMLIYQGGKTYPSIAKSHQAFLQTLKTYVPEPFYKVQKNKGHIFMIVQFVFSTNPRYREIKSFIKHPNQNPF